GRGRIRGRSSCPDVQGWMMKSLYRSWWLPPLLALAASAVLWQFRPGHRSRLELESASPVVGGLRLKVSRLARQGDEVLMTFGLEWVGPRGVAFMRQFGPVFVEFYDDTGVRMPEQVQAGFRLGRGFTSGDYDPPGLEWLKGRGLAGLCPDPFGRHEETETIFPPPGARYLTITLGGSQVTRPAPLPD